ncbi:MAG: DUF444 family protein [Bacteroidales bacterium]|nr:DUF444 family protein [Bacteroidales bacterium]MCF8455655.1 DUF444 family protein [Bacteroidales bacterium]
MKSNEREILRKLIDKGLPAGQRELIERELEMSKSRTIPRHARIPKYDNFFSMDDFFSFYGYKNEAQEARVNLKTLEELLEQDKQRDADGFPKRVKIGRLIKPVKGKSGKVIIVPTTTEPKFYHDNSMDESEEGQTGGSGEGAEGEVIGKQPAQPEDGEGTGAGQGGGGDHDISSEAFDLGKLLTEKFQLPNIKDKGKKKSMTKVKYDLTDTHKGFGQLLDKKATLRQIVETNILLGRIKANEPFSSEKLLVSPQDNVFRILSKEKDYENQAMVFFIRDYSGSMSGKPTESVCMQHLFIYSWLMYQYQNNVEARFILHDTEAKEVKDFATYYRSQIAGGTQIYPAFELVNKMVIEKQLAIDYNLYVYYGTDGDDWDQTGTKTLAAIEEMLKYINRLGISIARNSWSNENKTTLENYIEDSGMLKKKSELFKLDSFNADTVSEERLIEGIKKLNE